MYNWSGKVLIMYKGSWWLSSGVCTRMVSYQPFIQIGNASIKLMNDNKLGGTVGILKARAT